MHIWVYTLQLFAHAVQGGVKPQAGFNGNHHQIQRIR
jgi:hypothetical protein